MRRRDGRENRIGVKKAYGFLVMALRVPGVFLKKVFLLLLFFTTTRSERKANTHQRKQVIKVHIM